MTTKYQTIGENFSFYAVNFQQQLNSLKENEKPIIDGFTKSAGIGCEISDKIVDTIIKYNAKNGIIKLYLIDSIVKNIGGEYLTLFGNVLIDLFTKIFAAADVSFRKKLFTLRHTWSGFFPKDTLRSLDISTKKIDANWPVENIESVKVS